MGSNGTVEERLAEAEEARGARRGVADEPALPDRGIGRRRRSDACRRRADPPRAARGGRAAVLVRSPSRSRRGEHVLTEAIFNAGLRRYRAEGEPWKPEMTSATTSSTNRTQPSFVVDVSEHYETKRRALACHASSSRRRRPAPCRRV